MGNDADAADAAQEAFFDAFRNLHHFDSGREFYPRTVAKRLRP